MSASRIGALARLRQALQQLRVGLGACMAQHRIGRAALARHHLGGQQGHAQLGHGVLCQPGALQALPPERPEAETD